MSSCNCRDLQKHRSDPLCPGIVSWLYLLSTDQLFTVHTMSANMMFKRSKGMRMHIWQHRVVLLSAKLMMEALEEQHKVCAM